MLYGISDNGSRVLAKKGIEVICPYCKKGLVAKCGQILVHHWAHKQTKGCPYAYGMTEWHYYWLIHFNNLSSQGWTIEYFFNSIRFDAYNSIDKIAIEFQRIIDIDYIYQKIDICKKAGIKLFWIISPSVFQNYIYTIKFLNHKGLMLFASRHSKQKISLLLENPFFQKHLYFLIDFKKVENLLRYSTDSYDGRSFCCWTHSEAHPNPMKTGIYLISKMQFLDNPYSRGNFVFFLEHLSFNNL